MSRGVLFVVIGVVIGVAIGSITTALAFIVASLNIMLSFVACHISGGYVGFAATTRADEVYEDVQGEEEHSVKKACIESNSNSVNGKDSGIQVSYILGC